MKIRVTKNRYGKEYEHEIMIWHGKYDLRIYFMIVEDEILFKYKIFCRRSKTQGVTRQTRVVNGFGFRIYRREHE